MDVFKKRPLLLAFAALILLSIAGCFDGTFDTQANFAGSQSCVECHEKEFDLWKGSDHDNAMDTAIASTVLGDFNNAEFEFNGFINKFYIRDGRYFVYTEGPDGNPGEFQVAYTFGIRPLQQYLIPFENGRYQVLPITWDTEKNEWYHMVDTVYHGQEIQPDDWLYWTNNGQNWNGMCAECHSTNLRKNYNPETHVYNTTWSEIDVSCEACHGPGSNHNEWAEFSKIEKKAYNNYGLVVQTSNISSRELVDQCAYCHARRTSFDDFIHPRNDLFDIISPHLPTEPYYFPDGQILEEDYVYGSFTQSKMHQNNVRCTNCHDVHSLNLKFDGNKLCQQCHKKEKYDNYEHHFHKNFNEEGEPLVLNDGNTIVKVGEGAQCVACHMPGRYFMGVDYRRDHSMRIPRPDLSEKLGTPNACNQCHTDQTSEWAASYTEKWYPESNLFHFGESIFLAQQNDTIAIDLLVNLINSELTSPLIKATATSYLVNFLNDETMALSRELLKDKEALVRREAIRSFVPNDAEDLIQSLAPLLFDSTKMIRMEAAYSLSGVPFENFDSIQRNQLTIAIDEYIAAMEYTADFAASRHNLGNIYGNLGQTEKAIENYNEAIKIDNQFFPAKVNLAMLYNNIGRNNEAELLLKDVANINSNDGNTQYSLGLLLAEEKKYEEAVVHLENAAKLLPGNARVFYNLGLLQDFLGDKQAAQTSLITAKNIEPDNLSFQVALIDFYLKQKEYSKAKPLAIEYKENNPDDQSVDQLIEFIDNQLK